MSKDVRARRTLVQPITALSLRGACKILKTQQWTADTVYPGRNNKLHMRGASLYGGMITSRQPKYPHVS